MKLYIAEKPSLGRAIAAAIPGTHRQQEGYIQLANGDCVSWCIGHLLEAAEPEVYHPNYKKWNIADLPIIPDDWQLVPKVKTKKQLSVLKKLVMQADSLVHAGDPDREGQLLVDELLSFIKVSPKKLADTQRLLVNDLNRESVMKALSKLRPNRDFIPLSVSALARSRADWLYGINMTRLSTLKGQASGYAGVLSVGRVQTPVIGLVVDRDRDIENFESKPFYEVWANLRTEENLLFDAKWIPSEACEPYQDDEGRILSKPLAYNVLTRITGKLGKVTEYKSKRRRVNPPLPYNLSALQIDAAKRYNLSPKQVLDICQLLYEKYQLITYPRSDCRYLPESHHAEARRVLDAVKSNTAELVKAVDEADGKRRGLAWNDHKVSAHHGIIPTIKTLNISTLNPNEQRIYTLIAKQYLMQFYPPHSFDETVVDIDIEGGLFRAKSKVTVEQGWKVLQSLRHGSNTVETDSDPKDQDQVSCIPLPLMKEGTQLECVEGRVVEKQTQPPKHFTEATLLAAMTGIARFVSSAQIKKILKDTDGLGTEATRAGIIDLVFKRGYLARVGKTIRATDIGKALIHALPEVSRKPDMTALWENELNRIVQREKPYTEFMTALTEEIKQLVSALKHQSITGLPKSNKTPFKHKANRKGKKQPTGNKKSTAPQKRVATQKRMKAKVT